MMAKVSLFVAFVCYLLAAVGAYMGNTAFVINMLFNATQALFLFFVLWRIK